MPSRIISATPSPRSSASQVSPKSTPAVTPPGVYGIWNQSREAIAGHLYLHSIRAITPADASSARHASAQARSPSDSADRR